eukprot:m.333178 g.333178  ORF g.333178 m.333178 type:complete len:326 (-) comp27737_c0_seq1:1927-2904(-)
MRGASGVTSSVTNRSVMPADGRGESGAHQDETAPNAPKIKHVPNVNGKEYWPDWVAAGGNMDQYVKDVLPNYAITAGLMITMTFPFAIDVPEHVSVYSPALAHGFLGCMALATALNFSIILKTIALYQQYCCTINEDTAKTLVAHFAGIIPQLQVGMVLVGILFSTAMVMSLGTIDVGATDGDNQRFYITLFILLGLVLIHTLFYMWWIPYWNRSYNYVVLVTESKKRNDRIKNESTRLEEMVRKGVTDEESVNEVMAILHKQGFRDCSVLVDFMQSHAGSSVGLDAGQEAKKVALFATPLERLSIKPLHALMIAKSIGIGDLAQ